MSNQENEQNEQEEKLPIEGLGTSAGGLEALKTFFESLPDDTGIAFNIVLHLAPNQESDLAELLQMYTSLVVRRVRERTKIERNHVYVIPPDKLLSVEDGHLELSESKKEYGRNTVSVLLGSLAKHNGKHVVHNITEKQNFQEVLASIGIYALERNQLPDILHRAVQQSCISLHTDCGLIATVNPEKDTFKIEGETGCARSGAEIVNDKKWDLGAAFRSEKPVTVADYSRKTPFAISPALKDRHFTSSVHIAIKGIDDTYGVLGFYTKQKRDFSQNDLYFIRSMANMLGRMIEHHQAKEALSQTNAQLQKALKQSRAYQKEILNNDIAQRWKLGGYLHDNLGQLLAAAKITIIQLEKKLSDADADADANTKEEITQLKQIIDDGIEGIRGLTHDTIPVDIEEDGVEYAFRFLIKNAQRIHHINCTLNIADHALDEIKNRKLATHLYHIIQEAVRNAATHGEAKNVTLSIDKPDDHLSITIRDDGIGLGNSTESPDGKGIRIMKHRMDLLGGTFSFENGKDGGSLVTCRLPLEKLSENDE
jgi:two-component system CheB/CheR fusion protein